MSRQRQGWYPPALRWWNLIFAILLCWASIAVLQYYLHQSQRDGGVIFATKLNDIPLRRSFWYLYLPTILAVIFSVFIVWIDHDAKRYEPYRQMSKPGGARAEDSVLLHYPFDFALFVPLLAAKRRHWLVFWASLAGVLTTFGVVPLQAGILSVKETTRTFPQSFAISDKFVPPAVQESELNLRYVNSAYGILELNETLPSFMTRNYTLAPFAVKASKASYADHDTWTANTTLYSMDMECKQVDTFAQAECDEKVCRDSPDILFDAAAGCTVLLRDFSNNTIGKPLRFRDGVSDGKARYKTFSSAFAGHYDNGLFVDSANATPQNSSCTGLIVAAFVRNKNNETDPRNNITAMTCRPSYYEQDVEATIDTASNAPLSVNFLGSKRPLSEGLFNVSSFEGTVSPATVIRASKYRGNSLPGTALPEFRKANSDPDLSPAGMAVAFQQPYMTAMAVEISEHAVADFIDPRVMEDAYAAAYRLLFVRAMVDVLDTDFTDSTHETDGRLVIQTETLIFEPTFTYLVECFLGLVSVSMMVLLYMAITEPVSKKLIDEAGSIASAMSMVADDSRLLSAFEDLDCSSTSYLKRKLRKRAYVINSESFGPRINEIPSPTEAQQPSVHDPGLGTKEEVSVGKAIRPSEFRSYIALPFTSFFVALVVVLAVAFAKSQPHGLALPSQKALTLNIITKYLPTAAATLIEPMWILINRLLCVLQPLESLRRSKPSASASISLNYTSLPPQLMIAKALRSGHLMIASVCAMALLANLLATSFAGLLYQKEVMITQNSQFTPPFEARFANISRPMGGSSDRGAVTDTFGYTGDKTARKVVAPFLASETNYTRNTTLPAWVDEDAMYLPFMDLTTTMQVPEGGYKARTKYFTVDPNCSSLVFNKTYTLGLAIEATNPDDNPVSAFFGANVTSKNGTDIQCQADIFQDTWLPRGPTAVELLSELSTMITMDKPISNYDTCRSAALVGWMRMVGFEQARSNNTLVLACRPRLVIGEADVHVDSDGILQSRATNQTLDPDQSVEALSKYTTNGLDNLIAHANQALFITQFSGFHNDSFTGERFHYFINRAAGHTRFTDPNEPLPTYEDVIEPLTKAHKRLFAIWLGLNRDSLFVPAAQDNTQVTGSVVASVHRLFLVTPLFIISEAILGIYILTSILVYLRRPGQYLTRMPTSLASIIALFASSAAVKDLQETSHMTNKERDKYLKDLDARYGYGSYVGGDGSVHVGIEKSPFVRHMKQTTFEGSRFEKEVKKISAQGKKEDVTVTYTALGAQDGIIEERAVSPLRT